MTLVHSGEKDRNKELKSDFICTHHLVVAEQLVSNKKQAGRKKGSSVILWVPFYKMLIKHKK